jgi:hypothetical protein
MKSWLGVIGRACLEFAIILILISFATGASTSVAASSSGPDLLYMNAARAALSLVPLATVITLFLAFFAFEHRIKSRAGGWVGLLFLGILLFSFGLGLRRVPFIQETLAVPVQATGKQSLIPAGVASQRDRIALLIGSYEGGQAVDAVAVDFGSDYPRLAYSERVRIDPNAGKIDVQGKDYSAVALPLATPLLVPEASIFEGSWIWDRFAAMDGLAWYFALAAAGGFVLLAIGFRFLCRLTLWPLANALLAAAGLAGLVALDAFLSGPGILGPAQGLAIRSGLSMPESLLLASIEGALGLVLGVIEFAAAPKHGSRRHE